MGFMTLQISEDSNPPLASGWSLDFQAAVIDFVVAVEKMLWRANEL